MKFLSSALNGSFGTVLFSDDLVYRYLLGRVWDDTLPAAAWIMLNPSTASHEADDATIRKCVGFAKRWGLGGIMVVNLFAVRATDPSELLRLADPEGPGNLDAVGNSIIRNRPAIVLAAWGAHMLAAAAAPRYLAALEPICKLTCLGVTASGAPRHPLYVSYATEPQPYPL